MTVRVGVIGTGMMGADHVRLLSGHISGATVSAVSDINRARAAAVGDQAEGARVFGDPIALIADDGVDAVLVASPDESHERFVLASIAAGKPVLCEKPLTPTVAGCAKIIDAELSQGRRLVSVGFMRRYDPGYVELKRVFDSGRLGRALMMHCVHRNASAPAGHSSSMLITGSAVHDIDIARWLLDDEIVAATVHIPRRAARAGTTQDPQMLLLETSKGVLIDVEIFLNAGYGYEVRCELVGEDGTLLLDAPTATVLRADATTARQLARDWLPRFSEAYRRELQDWIDGIRIGKQARCASPWDGYVATMVAEAGVHSLTTGARQDILCPPRPALYTSSG